MTISPFFKHLRTSYQAELDDLTSDSEGKDVLKKRLAEKRKELDFLKQMIELSPEMVAVVFHDTFKVKLPAVLDDLLSFDSEELRVRPNTMTMKKTMTMKTTTAALITTANTTVKNTKKPKHAKKPGKIGWWSRALIEKSKDSYDISNQ